jgi:soluble lytic murein transglycosylase-like protein
VLGTGEEARIVIRMATREKPVRGMIQGLSRRYGVDASTAIHVAQCESGMNPRAYSPPYAGIFQHDVGYWPRRAANYGHKGDSPFDAYANIDVSLRMAAASGWRHWGCA